MSPVLTLERVVESKELNNEFLQDLIEQIRLADKFKKYLNWSDELLLDQFINSSDNQDFTPKNFNLDYLNQILVNAFYQAIGVHVERITGYSSETYVHLKNKEFSSAVISCGGVLVLYSLMWGYKRFGFLSLQELINSAEIYISNAVMKASLYLDF